LRGGGGKKRCKNYPGIAQQKLKKRDLLRKNVKTKKKSRRTPGSRRLTRKGGEKRGASRDPGEKNLGRRLLKKDSNVIGPGRFGWTKRGGSPFAVRMERKKNASQSRRRDPKGKKFGSLPNRGERYKKKGETKRGMNALER